MSNPTCEYLGNGEWFYREFTAPFGDDVELRICTDGMHGVYNDRRKICHHIIYNNIHRSSK